MVLNPAELFCQKCRVLTGDKKSNNIDLLNGSVVSKSIEGKSYNVSHVAHPEICRINKDWKNTTDKALKKLGQYIIHNKLNT